jgi:hypothetical protein
VRSYALLAGIPASEPTHGLPISNKTVNRNSCFKVSPRVEWELVVILNYTVPSFAKFYVFTTKIG